MRQHYSPAGSKIGRNRCGRDGRIKLHVPCRAVILWLNRQPRSAGAVEIRLCADGKTRRSLKWLDPWEVDQRRSTSLVIGSGRPSVLPRAAPFGRKRKPTLGVHLQLLLVEQGRAPLTCCEVGSPFGTPAKVFGFHPPLRWTASEWHRAARGRQPRLDEGTFS